MPKILEVKKNPMVIGHWIHFEQIRQVNIDGQGEIPRFYVANTRLI
jgi:hypothetical protein